MLRRVDLRRGGWARAVIALVLVLTGGGAWGSPPLGNRLLDRDQLNRLGLVRSWFAQVEVDVSHSRVERAIVSGNDLFVLSNVGILQSLNASTGATNWAVAIGNPRYPSMGPTANETQVAIVNGVTLYVLDRLDGRVTTVRKLGGAGAAPAMSDAYCFVPMVTGRIEGYPVGINHGPPWFYMSSGRAMVSPLVSDQSIVWSTDQGHINIGNALQGGVRFRLETGSEIVAPPAAHGTLVYVGTVDGELIAIDELTASQPWRFAAGYPIVTSPAAVGGRVYVASSEPALSAVDAVSGRAQWVAPKIVQFASASRERVYALDNLQSLVVLNAANGAVLGRIPTSGREKPLMNDQTDRLYLVSTSGLVQCFHEIGLNEPIQYQPKEVAKPLETAMPSQPPAPAASKRPAAPTSPENDNPFGAPAGGAADSPFGPFGGPGGGGNGGAAGGGAGASGPAGPGGGQGGSGPAAGGGNPFGGGAGPSDNPFGGSGGAGGSGGGASAGQGAGGAAEDDPFK